MSRNMTRDEWHAFVSAGTRTGKLAVVRKDGTPHVVPVWFVLDGDDFVFTTGRDDAQGQRRCGATAAPRSASTTTGRRSRS